MYIYIYIYIAAGFAQTCTNRFQNRAFAATFAQADSKSATCFSVGSMSLTCFKILHFELKQLHPRHAIQSKTLPQFMTFVSRPNWANK